MSTQFTLVMTEHGKPVMIYPTSALGLDIQNPDQFVVKLLIPPYSEHLVDKRIGGVLEHHPTQIDAIKRAVALRKPSIDTTPGSQG